MFILLIEQQDQFLSLPHEGDQFSKRFGGESRPFLLPPFQGQATSGVLRQNDPVALRRCFKPHGY